MREHPSNMHIRTVEGFGKEWAAYDQSELDPTELRRRAEEYFWLLPPGILAPDARVADIGCGSGRWAVAIAPQVGTLFCVDPSVEALGVAQRNLQQFPNCEFINSSVDDLPPHLKNLDLVYSLGVLHHVPNTGDAIKSCARLLAPGKPLILYLYYSFENRPFWFRAIWRVSDLFRRIVSRLPFRLRKLVTQVIAVCVYWPLARFARLSEACGIQPQWMPLSFYRDKSFYTMCTDALDRFGTALEQRFTTSEIGRMMTDAGLERVCFSIKEPYWCVIGWKKL